MSDTNIKPGVDFEIWNNDDRGEASDRFSNTQYQDKIVGNTDSQNDWDEAKQSDANLHQEDNISQS